MKIRELMTKLQAAEAKLGGDAEVRLLYWERDEPSQNVLGPMLEEHHGKVYVVANSGDTEEMEFEEDFESPEVMQRECDPFRKD